MTDRQGLQCQIKTESGQTIMIEVEPEVRAKIESICFRGAEVEKASNFDFWSDLKEMFEDESVRRLLARKLDERLEVGEVNFDIELKESIGFADVLTLDQVTPRMIGLKQQEVEEFDLFADMPDENGKKKRKPREVKPKFVHPISPVKRLMVTDETIKAPQTTLACFLGEAEKNDQGWILKLSMVRPGPDIGPRRGRVTERMNVAFLPPENPGDVEGTTWPMITTV